MFFFLIICYNFYLISHIFSFFQINNLGYKFKISLCKYFGFQIVNVTVSAQTLFFINKLGFQLIFENILEYWIHILVNFYGVLLFEISKFQIYRFLHSNFVRLKSYIFRFWRKWIFIHIRTLTRFLVIKNTRTNFKLNHIRGNFANGIAPWKLLWHFYF